MKPTGEWKKIIKSLNGTESQLSGVTHAVLIEGVTVVEGREAHSYIRTMRDRNRDIAPQTQE